MATGDSPAENIPHGAIGQREHLLCARQNAMNVVNNDDGISEYSPQLRQYCRPPSVGSSAPQQTQMSGSL